MATNYELSLTRLSEQHVSTISLEDVIAQLQQQKMSQKEIVQKLQAVQSTQEHIDDTYIIKKFLSEYDDADYALDEDGDTKEKCKWYSHEEQLKAFSKKFPAWLFILSGEGDEPGDIWKKYFVNGKIQYAKAKLSFDEFDMNKLK